MCSRTGADSDHQVYVSRGESAAAAARGARAHVQAASTLQIHRHIL